MYKKITSLLILVCLTLSLFVGCDSSTANEIPSTTEIESRLNAFDVEYSENKDGTYTCRGNSFKYKIEVSGIEGNKEATFLILTNNKDISFETVSKSLSSSEANTKVPEFVILGWY